MNVRHVAIRAIACCLFVIQFAIAPFASAQGPGKEHAELKKLEGKWKAIMKMEGSEVDATCVFKMTCGDMWLESNLEGDFGGFPFHGKGLDSYDASKKEYVAVWVDSMNGAPMVMTGKKEGKVTTMVGEGPGPAGVTKYKTTTNYESDDKMVFVMYTLDGDKETEMMTVTYTRTK